MKFSKRLLYTMLYASEPRETTLYASEPRETDKILPRANPSPSQLPRSPRPRRHECIRGRLVICLAALPPFSPSTVPDAQLAILVNLRSSSTLPASHLVGSSVNNRRGAPPRQRLVNAGKLRGGEGSCARYVPWRTTSRLWTAYESTISFS
jgi:hypothetical protein